ncbi:PREDICTED: uncharacterized protein LOC105562248, partial [Vollenhovia emeryi]|uniref:uncharacterized protein LOC105562248 n=1 Tax=Vollenhovia emeryi TaxID=411798 RepID=UPI0005F57073
NTISKGQLVQETLKDEHIRSPCPQPNRNIRRKSQSRRSVNLTVCVFSLIGFELSTTEECTLLLQLKKPWRNQESISKCLEIGCGPGDITKDILLPSLGSSAHIIGVDISEPMVKYANEKYGDEKRLQFEVLDIETKNLPKKYISEFDHIFSFHTLHWCSDIRHVLKNIYQMLQPNGFAFLQIVAAQDYLDIMGKLIRDIRFAQYVPEHIRNILPYQEFNNTRKGFKELLQSEGFTVHHCSLRNEVDFEEKAEPFIGMNKAKIPKIDGRDMWPALVSERFSLRQEVLINIDDIAGYSAIRRGNFKYVDGETQLRSNWIGDSGKSPNENRPSYDPEKVLHSKAGIAIAQITNARISERKRRNVIERLEENILTSHKILQLRHQAEIHCNVTEQEKINYGTTEQRKTRSAGESNILEQYLELLV